MVHSATSDPNATYDALVVGGDEGFQSQISEFLADRGFNVSTCQSIGEAPGSFDRHRVVLTVVPPGANGELNTFVDSIRSKSPDALPQPLIVGIGKSFPSTIEQSGFDELLVAPIDLDDLGDRIDSGLQPPEPPKRLTGNSILERLLNTPKPADPPPPAETPDPAPQANDPAPFTPATEFAAPSEHGAPATGAPASPEPQAPAFEPATPFAAAGEPTFEPEAATPFTPAPEEAVPQPTPEPEPAPSDSAPAEPTPDAEADADPDAARPEHVRVLLENAPLAMALFDGDMRYLAANRLWLEEFHLDDVPLVGRSQYEIFPDLHESWHHIYDRCLEGHTERCDEDVFKRADGSQDWVRWEVRPWKNDSGAIGGLIISCEVINHLKRAQRELHFERNLATALFSTHSAPIMVIDLRGHVLRANPAAEQLADAGQLTGLPSPYWEHLLAGPQREASAFLFASLDTDDNRDAQVPATTVETLTLASGETTVTWLNIPQRHADGSIQAIVRIGALKEPDQPAPEEQPAGPAEAVAPEAAAPATPTTLSPALDDLPDPVWRCDTRGRLEYVNRAWVDCRRLVGQAEIAEEYGKGWLRAFHERDRRSIANKIAQAINKRTPFTHEARLLRLSDTPLPVMLRARPAYDIDDHFTGLVGTISDFSEKALLEETLHTLRKEATSPRKAEASPPPAEAPAPEPQLVAPATPPADEVAAGSAPEAEAVLAIAHTIPAGLLLIDPSGALVYANPQHIGLLGTDARGFENVEDWLRDRCADEVHGEAIIDIWRDRVWRKQVRRVLTLLNADGIQKEIEFQPSLLNDGRLLVVATDVTEAHRSNEALRTSETRLRALVREADIPFAAIDRTGDICYASAAFENLLGYSPLQLRRLKFDDCLHAGDVATKNQALACLADGAAESGRHPVRLITRSGETVSAELRATPVHDDRGNPVLTAFYLTPYVAGASPAAPSASPAPSAPERRDDSSEPSTSAEATTASTHRTRNDLQLVFSLLNLQKKAATDPASKAAIAAAQARVRAVANVHQQLTDPDNTGTPGVALAPFAKNLIDQLIAGSEEGLAGRIGTDIALEGINVPQHHAAAIGLLLNELLTNAFQHAFPENISGTVRVAALGGGPEGDLVITVKDDGIGLPADFPSARGSGLGIQIVEALTDQLGGKLDIANDDETEFRLTFSLS